MKTKLIFILSCLLLACQTENLDLTETQSNNSANITSTVNSNNDVQTIDVSGEMFEQVFQLAVTNHFTNFTVTSRDIWTGSLAGKGHIKIFSGDVIDPYNTENIIAERFLFTSEGNLFFDEIGTRHDDDIYIISTIKGGTGIYKKAQGQLILNGIHGDTGYHTFTYTGSITIPK